MDKLRTRSALKVLFLFVLTLTAYTQEFTFTPGLIGWQAIFSEDELINQLKLDVGIISIRSDDRVFGTSITAASTMANVDRSFIWTFLNVSADLTFISSVDYLLLGPFVRLSFLGAKGFDPALYSGLQFNILSEIELLGKSTYPIKFSFLSLEIGIQYRALRIAFFASLTTDISILVPILLDSLKAEVEEERGKDAL